MKPFNVDVVSSMISFKSGWCDNLEMLKWNQPLRMS
jgi:hypothetical protein